MGMQTRAWGVFWHVLHMISLNFSVAPSTAQRVQYKRWFTDIGHILPCAACRESYQDITGKGALKITQKVFKDRASLSLWLYRVHNEVSRRIGDENRSRLTYSAMCRRYEKCRATQCGGHKCDVPDAKNKKRSIVLLVNESDYQKSNNLQDLVKKSRTKSKSPFVDLTR